MATLPVRKFIKVWIERRKNRVRRDGSRNSSYTLEWLEFGQRRFLSLGPHATLAFAREAARRKEQELNSPEHQETLVPILWPPFIEKYLETFYPGRGLPVAERKSQIGGWSKSLGTYRREQFAIGNFKRLIEPGFCHEITAENREEFCTKRLGEVGSALTVEAELRVLRHLCNVMEEWNHRPGGSNPFAGRGKATVGERRRRAKQQGQEAKEKHYSFEDVGKILSLATREAAADPSFTKKRLRALVYFIAYTGCRINEAIHLEWSDIDWERSIAWLYFKVENDLKTQGSEAPFGLPDKLLAALREWEKDKTCTWVFPNSGQKPWKTSGPGYKHLDQLKALAKRAGISDATWKRFRHSLSTHGKQRFGMTKEQIQAQLRHTTIDTQKQYDHDDLANLRDAIKGVDFDG